MLVAPSIERREIDSWPVSLSGLPTRVVNSVTPSQIQVIGELRHLSDSELMQFRSLGRISLRHIHQFFELCNNIEQGRQCFNNLDEILKLFLDQEEYQVLAARYGFTSPRTLITRSTVTLHAVGQTEHKTRERIRQIQDVALRKLSNQLPSICLRPFFSYVQSILHNHGQVITADELLPFRNDPVFSAHNPCGVILLLCDLPDAGVFTFQNFFSLVHPDELQHLEAAALNHLSTQPHPVGMEKLIRQLPVLSGLPNQEQTQRIVEVLLDHCSTVASTTDSRFFLYDLGVQAFLQEILKSLSRPVHYRLITQTFNDHLKPRSRKGAGYVLERLNSSPDCIRVDRGIYDLTALP